MSFAIALLGFAMLGRLLCRMPRLQSKAVRRVGLVLDLQASCL